MPRFLILSVVMFAVGLAAAWPAAAEQAPAPPAPQKVGTWPEWVGKHAPNDFTSQNFERGEGFYFSIPKIVSALLLLLAWVATGEWVNRDAQSHKLNFRMWNSIVYGSFAAAFLLLFVLPFAAGFPLLVLAYGGSFGAYVVTRNKKRHESEKVFTLDHIKFVLFTKLNSFGMKLETKKKEGPVAPVILLARNAPTPEDKQKREIAMRQSPGHSAARDVVYRSFQSRATSIMLDYAAEGVAVRFLIDGVWLDGEMMPRQIGDPVLAALKLVCGLKPEDRRTKQHGVFTAHDEPGKRTVQCKLTTQGTKTGERALIQFEDPGVRKRRLPDLGLRQKLQEDLQAVLSAKKGLIIIAAPPSGGLTSLSTACIAAIDRYTRSVMCVEEKDAADMEVENVQVTLYDALEQETPMTKLPGVIRQFPDVLLVPDMANAETAALLCEEALSDDRLVVTTVRAKEAAEALLLPAATFKVPLKKYAQAVTAVIAQRLIRKLCDKCKEAYPPQPQILQKLGIPADKVQAFYRPPTARQETCGECGGLGYKGQTALFELLVVDDLMRQTLVKEPKLESLRAAARKSGMKTFEDEGLLLVVKGVTSVPELARVLKGEPAPAAAAPPKEAAPAKEAPAKEAAAKAPPAKEQPAKKK